MKHLVSILIPVYNRKHLIGESIQSAINQSYSNIEIIVVDNCSNDGTWEVVQEFANTDTRIKVFQNNENIGPVRNWMRCINLAKGEFSKILFSDDLIAADFIEKTLKCICDDTAFVLSNVVVFKKSITDILYKNIYNYKIISSNEYINDIILFNNNKFPVSPSASLFRTTDLAKALLLDISNPLKLDYKKFGAGNDLLIFLKIASSYKYIRIANDSYSFFRHHANSFTIQNNLNVYYTFAKIYFLQINYKELCSSKKLLLFIEFILRRDKLNIYRYIPGNLNFKFLFSSYFFKSIFGKIYKLNSKGKIYN